MLRRRQMMEMRSGLDTSPQIIQYGVRYPNGNPTTKPLIEDNNACITEIYHYPTLEQKGTLVLLGGIGTIIVYRNGNYFDYWGFSCNVGVESSRNVINAQSDGIAFSMRISELSDCYAYLQETGQIFFAGENSIYYGHTNISELN